VRDEEVGQPQVGLEIDQEVQDLRLHETSSAETGSSAHDRRGCSASARAMPIALTLRRR
jgi:hypothetical protein